MLASAQISPQMRSYIYGPHAHDVPTLPALPLDKEGDQPEVQSPLISSELELKYVTSKKDARATLDELGAKELRITQRYFATEAIPEVIKYFNSHFRERGIDPLELPFEVSYARIRVVESDLESRRFYLTIKGPKDSMGERIEEEIEIQEKAYKKLKPLAQDGGIRKTRYLTSANVFDIDGNANEVEIAVDFVTHAGKGAKIPKLPSGSLPFAIVEAEFLQDRTLSRALAEQFRRGNHNFDLLKDRAVEIHPTDRIIGDHITMRYLSTHGADEVVRHESSLLEELIERRVGQLAPHIPSVVALDGVILTENIAKHEADLRSWVEHTDIKKERVRRTLLNSSAIADALSYAKKNRDLCSQLPDGKSIGFIPKAVWIEVVAHQRNKSRMLVIEGMPDHSGETPHVEVNLTTKQYNELALLRRSGSIRFTRYTFSGPVTSDGKAIGEAKIEVHALTHAGSSGRDGKIPDDSSTFLPVQIQLDDKALATDILNGSSQLPKLAQAVIFPPLGRDLGKTLRSDRVARRGVTSRTLKEVDLIRYASAN